MYIGKNNKYGLLKYNYLKYKTIAFIEIKTF